MFKRGCILRITGLLIIFSAVVVYLFDKYGKDFYESSKQRIYESFISELDKQINFINEEAINDSLKNYYHDRLLEIKDIDLDKTEIKVTSVINEIKLYIDSHSNQIENIDELRRIIKDYEQRKKD